MLVSSGRKEGYSVRTNGAFWLAFLRSLYGRGHVNFPAAIPRTAGPSPDFRVKNVLVISPASPALTGSRCGPTIPRSV